MGYLFLLFSLLAGVTKGFCGKRAGGYTQTPRDAVLANLLRMGLCTAIGFLLVLFQGGITTLRVALPTLFYALLAGVGTALFAVTWLLSVKRGAYMLVDVFLMCGVLIPVIGSTFLGERPRLRDGIGLVILLVAVLIMCSYQNKMRSRLTPLSLLLLLLTGVSSGLSDFSQKLFVARGSGDTIAAFNCYTYLFAAGVLLLYFLLTARRRTTEQASFPYKRISLYILIMAICMFAASYFQTLAAGYLPAAQLYPLSRGLALVLSALMAAICFREKLTPRAILGMALAFIALLTMNL